MKTSEVLFLVLLISCGKKSDDECLSREQVLTLCLAAKIKADPREWRTEYYKEQCAYQYPIDYCYPKSKIFGELE